MEQQQRDKVSVFVILTGGDFSAIQRQFGGEAEEKGREEDGESVLSCLALLEQGETEGER